ncbi:MAG: imidazole glycerol phosphate synthase subunit HisH [Verrucomicrobiota bacterium]
MRRRDAAGVDVVLADYGAGNLRSVCSALERAGARPSVTEDPRVVEVAPLTVIAGVGNTGAAARGLEERGLASALLDRVRSGRPLLGICVGMQLLFGESEEGGAGLAILPGRVGRLRATRVPHMGWNELRVTAPTLLLDGLDGEDVYFAHSYACSPEATITVAEVAHDGRAVVAAIEHGPVAGVQFHPERSGPVGARVLRNALAWSRSV